MYPPSNFGELQSLGESDALLAAGGVVEMLLQLFKFRVLRTPRTVSPTDLLGRMASVSAPAPLTFCPYALVHASGA